MVFHAGASGVSQAGSSKAGGSGSGSVNHLWTMAGEWYLWCFRVSLNFLAFFLNGFETV